ncbi:TM0106 family RecB-like putative nuclease [Corynebacterium testudinoris]|uniref:TM0106 family RecB-like putative nuclease n=1 Tax=Corynebacterium testudinoris TaxID=136857 RepID=UPI0021AB2FAA|nr:TM0106 family RecB-like putative nuclease [Corynebacterium testudinoris]
MLVAREAVLALLPQRRALGDGRSRRFLRVDVPGEDAFAAELATLEALAQRATLITGAVFSTAQWRVEVDILVRRPDGLYMPVIVSNHRVARAAQGHSTPVLATGRLGLGEPVEGQFRLRHHAIDGYRLGLAARALAEMDLDSGWGGTIGQDRTRAFLERTASFQPALDKALDLPLPRRPRRVKECATCRFRPLCDVELTELDDISLVLPGDRAEPFREQGITTVQELIDARWLGEPAALAKAWREGIPLLRRVDAVEAPRADVEIDVDMEAYLDQGAYLWGTFDGRDYRAFATWEPLGGDAEAENFARLWAWLEQKREQAHRDGMTFAAYCWSAHGENHWMRMSARRFGGRRFTDVTVPTEAEVVEFISSQEWVDMFDVVRRQLVGPYGLGLKVVAPVAGYAWADGDFDGEESVNARRVARGVDKQALETRSRLLRYNEDDCRATARVREWMRAGAPGTPLIRQYLDDEATGSPQRGEAESPRG